MRTTWLHATKGERRRKRWQLWLTVGFLVLLFGGMTGWLTGCENWLPRTFPEVG